jgi:hypothetical protein
MSPLAFSARRIRRRGGRLVGNRLAGLQILGFASSFANGQIGILVAEVPDQDNREQPPAYQTALNLRVQNSEQLQKIVKVRLIERPLLPDADAQQAQAVKCGCWLRAAFALRPFVVEGSQEPWLTVINPQDIFQPESSLGTFSSPRLATLDRLPLSADLAQLAGTALALTLSERQSYKAPAQVLGDALKPERLPEAATSRWALDHLRGDDLLAGYGKTYLRMKNLSVPYDKTGFLRLVPCNVENA